MEKAKSLHHMDRALPPTVLTIFGATGHLSANYLLPALFHMQEHNLLPKDFKLVCVGRRPLTEESFLDLIIQKSKSLKKLSKSKVKKNFLKHLIYFRGDFEDVASFKPLAKILADREKPTHQCFNRLYYFATTPQLFSSITRLLKESNLLMSCAEHGRKIRVLVEKPFGFNLKSAQDLNKLLLRYFTEDQIYRIDHYQGKETVQNLMVVRFANSLFEPLWNRNYIDHVEISVLEKDGVGGRAKFYDDTGALKDMVQNHIIQMLALLAMEEPRNLTAEHIRDEKTRIIRALKLCNKEDIKANVVRGQYQNYPKEIGHESNTETYVALKAFVDLPRWRDVPFYLRTGKALAKKVTQISVHFKQANKILFPTSTPNVLTFRIQPDEAVYLRIDNKIPGFGMELAAGDLDFRYGQAFEGELPSAYERLLLDFMEGDQRLFIRSDEIEAAWKFIDSITENWNFEDEPTYKYKSGSYGPKETDEFIGKDEREWWTK